MAKKKSMPVLANLVLKAGFADLASIQKALNRRLHNPSLAVIDVLGDLAGVSRDKLDELSSKYLKSQREFLELMQALRLVDPALANKLIVTQQDRARKGVLVGALALLRRHKVDLNIGDYSIRSCLGMGSMGAVLRARRHDNNENVALKIVRPDLVKDARVLTRFLREAKILTNIKNPNVVEHIETGRDGGIVFLAVEMVHGQDLGTMVKRMGRIPPSAAMSITASILDGLASIHETGIIHRDIKPDNILLTLDGVPKISDFGLARRTGEDESLALTEVGTVLGTPYYMSTEQCRGEEADFRSDLYSVGATLYHMVTGEPPYRSNKVTEIIMRHLKDPVPDATKKGVPEDVAALIKQLMAKDPAKRGASAGAVRDQIIGLDAGTQDDVDMLADTIVGLPEELVGNEAESESTESSSDSSQVEPATISGQLAYVEAPSEKAAAQGVVASGNIGGAEDSPARKIPFKSLIVGSLCMVACAALVLLQKPVVPIDPFPEFRVAEILRQERQNYSDARVDQNPARELEALRMYQFLRDDKRLKRLMTKAIYHGDRQAFERRLGLRNDELEREDQGLVANDLGPLESDVTESWLWRSVSIRNQLYAQRFGALGGVRETTDRIRADLRASTFLSTTLEVEADRAYQSYLQKYKELLTNEDWPAAAQLSWRQYQYYGGLHENTADVILHFLNAQQLGKLPRWDFRALDPRQDDLGLGDSLKLMIFSRVGPIDQTFTQFFLASLALGLLTLGYASLFIVYYGGSGLLWFVRFGAGIQLALLKGDKRTAAAIHERAGEIPVAAELYVEAGELNTAAELWLRADKPMRAAAVYEKANRHEAAANLYSKLDNHQMAAEAYLKAERYDSAANSFRRVGALSRAADAYLQSGRMESAAQMLEEEGRYAAAAKALESEYELASNKPGAKAHARVIDLALRIANLYERAEQYDQAAYYFRSAERPEEAAALFERAGLYREASEAFLAVGNKIKAIELLERLGDVHAASRQRGEVAMEQGDYQTAADAFEKVGDLKNASLALEKLGDYERAAKFAARVQDPERAANLLSKAGHYAKAGQAFERLGQPLEAVYNYEQANDFFSAARVRQSLNEFVRAAQSYQRAGAVDDAIAVLETVPEDDPDYFEGLSLHGQLVSEKYNIGSAVRLLEKRLNGVELDRYSVVGFRKLVELHERGGDQARARYHQQRINSSEFVTKEDEAVLARLSGSRPTNRPVPRPTTRPTPTSSGVRRRQTSGNLVRRPTGAMRPPSSQRNKAVKPGSPQTRRQGPLPRPKSSLRNSNITHMAGNGVPNEPVERFVGRTIDRYEVTDVLGEGAYAWVLKAKHVMLGRSAALKVLKPVGTDREHVRKRFLAEGRVISKLRHPHIVEVYDFGETPDGFQYMALEFLEGRDLRDFLTSKHQLDVSEAIKFTIQVLEALGAAHNLDVVHRDLKPENVFVVHEDSIRVLDFGIAKLVADTQSVTNMVKTQDGGFIGTPKYCSPEQATGEDTGPWTDIYAAGLILYEMLTGQLPFRSRNALGYLTHHASTEPKSPKLLRQDIPEPLANVVLKSLEKKPGARHASALAFAEVLRRFLA